MNVNVTNSKYKEMNHQGRSQEILRIRMFNDIKDMSVFLQKMMWKKPVKKEGD